EAGEAHVGDLVDPAQALHDGVADRARGDLAVELRLDDVDHVLDEHRDLVRVDRALVARCTDGTQQLFPIEFLPSSVALDDNKPVTHEHFRGAESVAALETFTTPADRIALLADAGIDHLVLDRHAFWTAHGGDGWVGTGVRGRWFHRPAQLVQLEEILEDAHAALGRDGLRVELDTPHGQRLV